MSLKSNMKKLVPQLLLLITALEPFFNLFGIIQTGSSGIDPNQFTAQGQIPIWDDTNNLLTAGSLQENVNEITSSKEIKVNGVFDNSIAFAELGQMHASQSGDDLLYTRANSNSFSLTRPRRTYVEITLTDHNYFR